MRLNCSDQARVFALILLQVILPWQFAGAATRDSPALTPTQRYALAAPAPQFTIEAAGVDRDTELQRDLARPKSLPGRYAVERAIGNVAHRKARDAGGQWQDLPDGMALWRIPLHAPGALSLDFVFTQFFLPPGAQLFIHSDSQTLGPYSDADNPRSRIFATPLIAGERAQIEVLLPQAMKPFLALELATLHAGYRDIFAIKSLRDPVAGSEACNVDTVCSQGDAWRQEINAVAALVANGTYCSGQLVNNTRADQSPLIATAYHCYASSFAASSLVVYWKYESPTCRSVNSSDNTLPVASDAAIAQTGGATLLMSNQDSDVTLMRLNSSPPDTAKVYFDGWDRSDTAFSNGVVIHHPNSDAKRISLGAGGVVVDDDPDLGEGIHHWRIDHYSLGTTEAGSSGSGLIDLNHHLRGVLSNGYADCSAPAGEDYYGRIGTAWNGGATSDERLADWLDPLATGATQLDGLSACVAPSVTLDMSASSIAVGDKVTLAAQVSGGTAPYRYAFDVDGDAVTDSTDPTQPSIAAVYPGAFAGNVAVSVTDSAGCSAHASRALIVQAPRVTATLSGTPIELCGDGGGAVNPGERWRIPVTVINNGSIASHAGFAIFAQNASALTDQIALETPAVALPALAPGAAFTLNLDYAVAASATCGATVALDYLGAVDDRSFVAASTTVFNTALGNAGNCAAVASCPGQGASLPLAAGSYYDPLRPGNGITLGTITQGAGDPVFFGVWFTGDAAREPTWYQIQAPLHTAQVNSPLYQNHQSAPNLWPVRPSAIGTTQITQIASDKFVHTWNISGTSGGAMYMPVTSVASTVRLQYNPSESGWGAYDQFALIAGPGAPPLIATVIYLYDALGAPRWLLASNPAYVAGATLQALSQRPSCPNCVWLDYTAGQHAAGTVVYDNANGNVHISTNIFFPDNIPGSWMRTNLPLTTLFSTQ